MIVGAYALAFHSRPRFTDDIGILIRCSSQNAGSVAAAMKAFGFGGPGLSHSDFEEPYQLIQLGHPPNRIDILTSISGVDPDQIWTHRVPASLEGMQVWFLDRQSLIENKRSADRDQDKADLKLLGGGLITCCWRRPRRSSGRLHLTCVRRPLFKCPKSD